jgi:hypothetical protein
LDIFLADVFQQDASIVASLGSGGHLAMHFDARDDGGLAGILALHSDLVSNGNGSTFNATRDDGSPSFDGKNILHGHVEGGVGGHGGLGKSFQKLGEGGVNSAWEQKKNSTRSEETA